MYLALWLIRRWRLPATPCLILPVAVSLKRFLTPLLVLSLGIFSPLLPWERAYEPPRQPFRPGRSDCSRGLEERAPIKAAAPEGNRLPGNLGAVAPQEAAGPFDRQPGDQAAHSADALLGREFGPRTTHARLDPAGAEHGSHHALLPRLQGERAPRHVERRFR